MPERIEGRTGPEREGSTLSVKQLEEEQANKKAQACGEEERRETGKKSVPEAGRKNVPDGTVYATGEGARGGNAA